MTKWKLPSPTVLRSVDMTRNVSSRGPAMYSGMPSLPNVMSLGPLHSPRRTAHLAKSGCGSRPRPRAYPTAPNTTCCARSSGAGTAGRLNALKNSPRKSGSYP
jgi:hypothetical protein